VRPLQSIASTISRKHIQIGDVEEEDVVKYFDELHDHMGALVCPETLNLLTLAYQTKLYWSMVLLLFIAIVQTLFTAFRPLLMLFTRWHFSLSRGDHILFNETNATIFTRRIPISQAQKENS